MRQAADKYRVREAVVCVCNGYRQFSARRFIAERRLSVLGLFEIWWPVTDGKWRKSEEAAKADADHDAHLRSPLAEPKLFEVEKPP